MSVGLNVMAWREILARVCAGFAEQVDVSPAWLVNPSTRRHLKLDLFYPEIAIAVRFLGMQGKRKGPVSDGEVMEEEQRDETRAELCRSNGVDLVSIPVIGERPGEPLRALSSALSRASRKVAQGGTSAVEKGRLMPLLAGAHERCEDLIRRVHGADDLALYAELWRDREAAVAVATQAEAARSPAKSQKVPQYQEGMSVVHTAFGPGTILAVAPEGDDMRVTVQFVTAGQRTFLASLAAGKLSPASNS